MRLNAPKQITWLFAVIAGILGIIAVFVPIPFISHYAFWVMTGAFGLLAVSTFFSGL